ncbi:MAG: hypothetical protein KA419_07910 [Acidobacteria bacterium]|nr:hypothetical protein [Acidobacteriota bacterium]
MNAFRIRIICSLAFCLLCIYCSTSTKGSRHTPTSELMKNFASTERAFADKFGNFATLQELARHNYLHPRFLTDPPQSIDGYFFSSRVGHGVFTLQAKGYTEHFARKSYYINQRMILCSDPACTLPAENVAFSLALYSLGCQLGDLGRFFVLNPPAPR